MGRNSKETIKKLQVVSFHSRSGGVGKSTEALRLAKRLSAQGKRVCVIDLDVIGAGLMPLLANNAMKKYLRQNTVAFLEQYLLATDTNDFDIGKLIIPCQAFGVILQLRGIDLERIQINIWRDHRSDEKSLTKLAKILDDNVDMLFRNELHFKEIAIRLNILFKKLIEKGFDSVILDCHTGVKFVAESLIEMATKKRYDWKLVWISPKPPQNTRRNVV
ncbi:MAG: AAA family ATPase [Patescibacteria group bacterium]